jgi:tetratricopeptide (TPR) repeat protein
MTTAMMTGSISASERRPFNADVAGLFYLTGIVTAAAAAFVRWRLVVPDDAMATAANILTHQPLFKLVLAADLISTLCYVAVTLLFYEMFKGIRKGLSLLSASLGLVSCGIAGFASFFHVAAWVVLRAAQYLHVVDVQPLPALALTFLRLRAQAYSVSLVFFGLYCLVIGYLIFKTTVLPRIAGAVIPVLLILIALPGIAQTGVSVPQITAGRAALDHGDTDQAIAQLEKAVAATANNFSAHYYLGVAYAKKAQSGGIFAAMSQIPKAKDEWLRALEIDPNSIDARLRLIDFYIMAPGIAGGSEEKALEQAAEAKKRDTLAGHRAYTHIYMLQKKFDMATKEMVEAVREQPKSAKPHYYLGTVLLNQKDWKGSLHEYEMALSLDPAYMPPYFRIGQNAAQSEANYARGEEALRKYLAYKPAYDEPTLARAWYWLGMIQEKEGKKPEARQSYTNAQQLTPDAKDINEALKRVSS